MERVGRRRYDYSVRSFPGTYWVRVITLRLGKGVTNQVHTRVLNSTRLVSFWDLKWVTIFLRWESKEDLSEHTPILQKPLSLEKGGLGGCFVFSTGVLLHLYVSSSLGPLVVCFPQSPVEFGIETLKVYELGCLWAGGKKKRRWTSTFVGLSRLTASLPFCVTSNPLYPNLPSQIWEVTLLLLLLLFSSLLSIVSNSKMIHGPWQESWNL